MLLNVIKLLNNHLQELLEHLFISSILNQIKKTRKLVIQAQNREKESSGMFKSGKETS